MPFDFSRLYSLETVFKFLFNSFEILKILFFPLDKAIRSILITSSLLYEPFCEIVGYKFSLPRFGSHKIFALGYKPISNASIMSLNTSKDWFKPFSVTTLKSSLSYDIFDYFLI